MRARLVHPEAAATPRPGPGESAATPRPRPRRRRDPDRGDAATATRRVRGPSSETDRPDRTRGAGTHITTMSYSTIDKEAQPIVSEEPSYSKKVLAGAVAIAFVIGAAAATATSSVSVSTST